MKELQENIATGGTRHCLGIIYTDMKHVPCFYWKLNHDFLTYLAQFDDMPTTHIFF